MAAPLVTTDPIYVRTIEIQWHWQFPDAKIQATAEGINSVDFHPSTFRICTTGLENTIRIWQLNTDDLSSWLMDSTQEMQRCCTWITSMTSANIPVCARWSPSGMIICSGHIGGLVTLWWRQGPAVNDARVACAAASSNGDAGGDAAAAVTPLEVWKDFRVLTGHIDDVNDVCFTPNSKYVVSISMHGLLLIHELEGEVKDVFRLEAHSKFCQSVTVDPWNRLIASFGGGPSLSFFAISPKTETRRLQLTGQKKAQVSFLGELCTTSLRRAAWSPDGSLFAAPCGKAKDAPEDMKNCFYVFTRQQLEHPVARFSVRGSSEVLGCAWAPCFFEPFDDPDTFAALDDVSNMRAWGPAEYRMALAVWTSDSVVVYTTDSGCRHSDFSDLHFSSITSVAWSHDARFLLTSSMDGYISVVMYHHPLGQKAHTTPLFASSGFCQSIASLLSGLKGESAVIEHSRTDAASRIGSGDKDANVAVVKKKKRLEATPKAAAEAVAAPLPVVDANELANLL